MDNAGDIKNYRFGQYVIDIASRQLFCDGEPVKIQSRVFDLLVYLARNPDRMVDKDELQDAVWPGRIVTETALSRAVMKARKAVGDDASQQSVIKTIHGHGYHFVAPVEAVPVTQASAATVTEEVSQKPVEAPLVESEGHGTTRWIVPGLVGMAILAFIGFRFLSAPPDEAPADAATSAVVSSADPTAQTRQPDLNSIAVLPFANRSSLEDDLYFADGIHDDLLTILANIGSLKVISRTSVMRFRDTELSIPQIASQLGVATILEGGIQRSAGQVRINVQLIDTETDEHLWAQIYDRELNAENLFAIQSEISHEIATALHATLSDRESQRLDQAPTDNLEAYGEFVLGRQAKARRAVDSLNRARGHFEKAIELDPEYALAYVGLADTLNLLTSYAGIDPDEMNALRQTAIDQALSLDPFSGEAYTSLAALRVDQQQYAEAEKHFLTAIELNPNYSTTYHWYAFMLERMGRLREAEVSIRKAIDLDPMAPVLTTNYARILWKLGEVEDAAEALQEGVSRNPQFSGHYMMMAANLRELGMMGESMQWLHAALQLDDNPAFVKIASCKRYLDFDDVQAAEICFDESEQAYPEASIGSRMELMQFTGNFPEALAEALALEARFPLPFARISSGWNYILNEQYEQTLEIVSEHWPQFIDDPDAVIENTDQLNAATLAGFALYRTGQTDAAEKLLEKALDYMKTIHRTRGEGYGELDVLIHALREDQPAAIEALEAALVSGWRDNWWRLRGPLYDSMQGSAEWSALLLELEADARTQQAWFEEHRDDPLF